MWWLLITSSQQLYEIDNVAILVTDAIAIPQACVHAQKTRSVHN